MPSGLAPTDDGELDRVLVVVAHDTPEGRFMPQPVVRESALAPRRSLRRWTFIAAGCQADWDEHYLASVAAIIKKARNS